MVKPTIKRVTSPRVRSKSPKIDDFMKNSMISPVFQYPGENYPISHQSHAPHTPHTSTTATSQLCQATADKVKNNILA